MIASNKNTQISIFVRFARTTRDVILRPWETFSRLGEGPLPLALAYPAAVYAMASIGTNMAAPPRSGSIATRSAGAATMSTALVT